MTVLTAPKITREIAIDLLHDLVATPSLSGDELAASHLLVRRMAQLGLDSHVDAVGNAIGQRELPDENGTIQTEIVLLGHIDTVPGDIDVRIEDGVLHGRGAVDAKGPLATFVIAAAQATLQPGTRIVVIGAVEEEAATSKGARFVVEQYRPNFCIIGEPSGWDGVTLGYKGRLLVDYEFAQAMGHTAGAVRGSAETSIDFYNHLMTFIEAFNSSRPRLFDQLLPSIRTIHTDSDGLTNSVFMKLGIRLPPEFDSAAFEKHLQDWAAPGTVRCYAHEPAYQSPRTTSLARFFNRTLRQSGARPRSKLKTGTSDMNVVGPIWNCPIVAYGPGDSSLDHTPNEHLVLDEFWQAVGVLTTVLGKLN